MLSIITLILVATLSAYILITDFIAMMDEDPEYRKEAERRYRDL